MSWLLALLGVWKRRLAAGEEDEDCECRNSTRQCRFCTECKPGHLSGGSWSLKRGWKRGRNAHPTTRMACAATMTGPSRLLAGRRCVIESIRTGDCVKGKVKGYCTLPQGVRL